MAAGELDRWQEAARALLNEFIETCGFDSDELDDLDQKRVLLVKLWLALNQPTQDLVNEFQPLGAQCVGRSEEYKRLLEGTGSGLGSIRLPLVAELTAASLALDSFLEFDAGPRPKLGYEVIPMKVEAGEKGTSCYWLCRRRAPIVEGHPTVRQMALPRFAFRYHQVIPQTIHGVVFDIEDLPLGRRVEECFRSNALKVYAAVFTDKVGLNVRWLDGAFVVKGYSGDADGDARKKRLKQICDHLDKAKEINAGLVLFPEMSITPELEVRVLEYMRKAGGTFIVALGSFHRQVGTTVKNIARVYCVDGTILVEQPKIRRSFLPMVPGNGSSFREDIECGRVVHGLHTPLGLIVVAICMDFCDVLQPSVWDELGADLVLVPSLGDEKTWDRHIERAKNLHRKFGAETVIAQQMRGAEGADNRGKCFIKTSGREKITGDGEKNWLDAAVLGVTPD